MEALFMNGQNNNATRNLNRGIFVTVLGFLALVFVLALGLILGAVLSALLLPVLAAVIAFAAAVLVSIIALLIYRSIRR